MEKSLESTPLCDSNNDRIRLKAKEITTNCKTQKESAKRIFSFVRDQILFNATLDIFEKASSTLKGGTVDYCNKINLHVALLRAIDIPARLQYVQIDKLVLRLFLPKFLYNRLPNPIGHFWCECYLNNKWIACEAFFDLQLYRGILEMKTITKEMIPTINWDGMNNLIVLKNWIIKEAAIYYSFDEIIENELKKVGFPPKLFCKLFDWVACWGSQSKTNKIRSYSS